MQVGTKIHVSTFSSKGGIGQILGTVVATFQDSQGNRRLTVELVDGTFRVLLARHANYLQPYIH